MIVAIHQPNYLPWLGYFYKMVNCEIFIFLDNVQYTKNGFINRNKIKTSKGPQWLTVDVLTKGHYMQKIKDVTINNQVPWAENHWKALNFNYARASYFEKYKSQLKAIYQQKWENLSLLNLALIEFIVSILGIKSVKFLLASSLDVNMESTELLVNLCKKVGADTYLSGFTGLKYMDESLFTNEGIKVINYDFNHPVYRQQWGEFIPNMSIIDLILNEGENSLNILKRH